MLTNKSFFERLFAVSLIFLALGFWAAGEVASTQEGSVEEIKYKEDYDRVQKIIKVRSPVTRTEQILNLYDDRPDMDSRLRKYTDDIFSKDLEALLKQNNYIALRGICEHAIKVDPSFGEAYLYYGVALKNDKRMEEAMIAFAKGFLIKNPLQKRAKQQLDIAYRSLHNGSLVGQDKIIEKAKEELGQ
jgi:tetratricopeptide (TPR) repeat protein